MLVVGHINPSGIFRLDMDSRLSIDSIDGFSSIGAYFAPGDTNVDTGGEFPLLLPFAVVGRSRADGTIPKHLPLTALGHEGQG